MTRVWQYYWVLRVGVALWIDDFTTAQGYPPVGAEMARYFGRSPAWAAQMLDRLERDGVITRSREAGITKKRTIRLTPAGHRLVEKNRQATGGTSGR